MRNFTFQLSILEEHYGYESGFFQYAHTIVDNEISNDIAPDWDYEKGIPICVGFLHDDLAEIFVAESDDDTNFRIIVMDKILQLAEKGYLFSFNNNMEHGNFKGAFNLDIPIKEIKPFKSRGWNKERFFYELIDHKQIPGANIFDPLNGNSDKVIEEWREYLKDKDTQHLSKISFHNLNCLLKEVVILKHHPFFLSKWEIDQNGFMLREK